MQASLPVAAQADAGGPGSGKKWHFRSRFVIYLLGVWIGYSAYLFTWCLYWVFSLSIHFLFVLVIQLIYSLGVFGVCIGYSAYRFTWCLYWLFSLYIHLVFLVFILVIQLIYSLGVWIGLFS